MARKSVSLKMKAVERVSKKITSAPRRMKYYADEQRFEVLRTDPRDGRILLISRPGGLSGVHAVVELNHESCRRLGEILLAQASASEAEAPEEMHPVKMTIKV